MDLTDYRTLGHSGLAVSPVALGAMTFGRTDWGSDEAESRAIFDSYVDAGGNFIDTANVYAGGNSERLLGRFVKERALRDQIVLATKGGLATGVGPNEMGLGAKNIHAALDGSLHRMGTDYIDIFWLHLWDRRTSADELVQTMSSLVRAGKIRYWGISNTPAWVAAWIAALAAAQGDPRPIALQYEYSLLERSAEVDLVPLALGMGMGLVSWSPLGGGLLTGKYQRGSGSEPNRPVARSGQGRLALDNPVTNTAFDDRSWAIAEVLAEAAREIGAEPAEVALAWLLGRPGVTAPLLGVSRRAQLVAALNALRLSLDAEVVAKLDAATSPTLTYPATLFQSARPGGAQARARVRGWSEQWPAGG